MKKAIYALLLTALAAEAQITHVPQNQGVSQYTGPVTRVPGPAYSSQGLTGQVQLGIKLSDPPLVVAVGIGAKQTGFKMTADQQRAYVAQINQKQSAVMAQVASMGGVELGRVSKAHNALIVSIDARSIQAIHGITGVVAVRPVADRQVSTAPVPDLATTNAYVGITSVQNGGNTGQGIRVALLDSGIDYTHYNLGGSGNISDYNSATAVKSGTPPRSLFPTTKVVGGYDFVGDVWPGGTLLPDANPIDLNGHGSHTADILGGNSLDNVHHGAAPGAQLYAVKVCSSVSSSCSGVAILQGLDFALDPTNSGTLNNAVDVISMSIGGSFGQRESDDSEAFTDIVNFGVVSVVSGGNDGDIPYIATGPSTTPEVLALAATNSVVASGIPLVINSPAGIAGTYPNTATLTWAPINAAVTANIVYVGRACPGDTLLANPNGAIALVDRGTCDVSGKVDFAANSGAVGVLIGLAAPGDAVTFAQGTGSNFPPSLVITQADANTIKAALMSSAVNGTLSPSNAISLATNVASFSSRGPNYSYNMLKPDMSAPGTMSAAQPGTGNGETIESGTSFACPLTAGAAALLLEANHTLAPLDVKALLMETAEVNVFNNAATQPGVLAPLSRAGSGELRADRAIAASTAVWDASEPLAVSISFGTLRMSATQSFKKKLVVRNYSNSARTYTITNTFRDTPNMSAVSFSSLPSTVFVAANSSTAIAATLSVNAAALPTWTLNGGSQGGNGELLNTVEFAGFLTFTSGPETVHVPWHILPHKAANVAPSTNSLSLSGNPANLPFNNTGGAVGGGASIFSLTGTGTQFPASVLPAPGADYAVINLQAVGVRLVCLSGVTTCNAYGVQFAITTFGQRSHPDVPAEFDVLIDVDGDGAADLDVFTADIGFETAQVYSGQNGVFIADLTAGTASGPYFYSVADLDSANSILTAPLSALKTSTNLSLGVSTPFSFTVNAFDNYFTGNLTDHIGPMQYELDMPRVYPALTDFTVAPGSSTNVTVFPNNAGNPFLNGAYNGNSPSQTGLLVMYTDGKAGQETSLITVNP